MWKFCLQYGGVSESFTNMMAAWEICLQDGGNDGSVSSQRNFQCFTVTVKRVWRHCRVTVYCHPAVTSSRWTFNRWRTWVSGTCEIWRPSVEDVTRGRSPRKKLCVMCFVVWPTRFAYKMAAFLRVLPTSWRRQTKRKQKQRRIYSTSAFSERDTTVIVKRVWRHRRVTRDGVSTNQRSSS